MPIPVPPERNVTLPAGARPALDVPIVAVRSTLDPKPAVLALEIIEVVVEPAVTVMFIGSDEVLPLKLEFPRYRPTIA